MILIIAEKPDVSKNIAHVVGAYERVEGGYGRTYCYRGNGYFVSNAIGHLYDIGMPGDYGFTDNVWDWNIDELPILPNEFKLFPNNKNDDGLNNQRSLLTSLLLHDDVTEIICATDAGREGELIFRYIYNYSGCKKSVKRLWISSLTEDAILSGLSNMKPYNAYDNLYLAGAARAKADWYVGMTLSRLYTVLDGSERCLHRVGRVKTPVLNIIAKRDALIRNFTKTPFYTLSLSNGAKCKTEFESRDEAVNIKQKCIGAVAACIKSEKKEKYENRPLLHSLNSLQREANEKYGYTAAEVLDITQKLYEKKLCTYPRTDSNYLTSDMTADIETIVSCFSDTSYSERANNLIANSLNIDKRIIDDSKVNDHHAIIPTQQIKSFEKIKLEENELIILSLIINRFLCALDKPCKYIEAFYVFDAEYEKFQITVKKPLELGWIKYNDEKFPSGEKFYEDNFPNYNVDDTFTVNDCIIKDCERQPPKHYTDGTLISAMENIDNIIDDKDLKSYVSGKGIGTTATRSRIIEELIYAGYIERNGKNIKATEFGVEFIKSIPESIKSVERTAEWEQTLDRIEKGECHENDLLDDIRKFLQKTVASEINSNRTPMLNTNVTRKEREVIGICPRCNKNIYEGKQNFYCESGKDGCGFTLWKDNNFLSEAISTAKAKKLLKGEAAELKSVDKDGKIYQASYTLKDTGEYVNLERKQFEKISLGKCPRCSKNIYEGKLNYYCESGKDGCGFTLWKENKFPVVTLTAKLVKELLKGKTLIKTKDINGNNVSADYVIEDTGKYINLKKV